MTGDPQLQTVLNRCVLASGLVITRAEEWARQLDHADGWTEADDRLYAAIREHRQAQAELTALQRAETAVCPACGRTGVRLTDRGELEGHNQAGRYDRPCHARWPNEHHKAGPT